MNLALRNVELYANLIRWKDVIIEALIVANIYNKSHDDNPRKALNDLLAWEAGVSEYFAHRKYKNAQMELDL